MTTTIQKKREVWIDIARVISAILIIYGHTVDIGKEYQVISDYSKSIFFNGRIPFFMILAGYFCNLNTSKEKWRGRLFYLGISMIIWNIIYLVIYQKEFNFTSVTGIGGGEGAANPQLWFLRDIFIFTLFTPIVARFNKRLFFAALFFVIMSKSPNELKDYGIPFPGNFGWFCMGMCLSRWQLAEIKSFLSKGSAIIFFMGILLGSIRGYFIANGGRSFQQSGAEELFGVMMICSFAILIEDYLPRIASFISELTSACFLSFVLHLLLLDTIAKNLLHYIPIYLIPIIIFAIIWCLERLLKYALPLAHPILAHSKYTEHQISRMKNGWLHIRRKFSFSKVA